AEWDDEIESLLRSTGWGENSTSNVLTTVVRHRALFKAWITWGGIMLHGELPRRVREIVILRTAWRQGCANEWAYHVGMATRGGLNEDEIADLTRARLEGDWTPRDRAVISAIDQLCAT